MFPLPVNEKKVKSVKTKRFHRFVLVESNMGFQQRERERKESEKSQKIIWDGRPSVSDSTKKYTSHVRGENSRKHGKCRSKCVCKKWFGNLKKSRDFCLSLLFTLSSLISSLYLWHTHSTYAHTHTRIWHTQLFDTHAHKSVSNLQIWRFAELDKLFKANLSKWRRVTHFLSQFFCFIKHCICFYDNSIKIS